jgi:hypothetical protein
LAVLSLSSLAQRVGYFADESKLALNSGTTTTGDVTADGGTAIVRTASQSSGGMWYGPYITLPAGNYIVQYRVKVSSNTSSATLITLDATNAIGANSYGRIVVHPNDFRASGDWELFSLPITVDNNQTNIEFRGLNFASGITDFYLDYVNVLPGDTRGYSSSQLSISPNGNIGIGTSSARNGLEVAASDSSNVTTARIGGVTSGSLSVPVGAEVSRNQVVFSAWRDTVPDTIGAKIAAINKNAWAANNALVENTDLAFFTLGVVPGTSDSTTEVMRLTSNGNLQLAAGRGGSIVFSDGSTQSTAWTGSLCGGDYAESIDVSDDRRRYEPGDVLVIDPKIEGKFLKSAEPYSMAVAGIYSTKPGVVGRRQTTAKNPDEIPMAVIGIVPAKVSAENGSIHPGDVLVTSSTPGYAMKGTDRTLLSGAIVGKAMGSLISGTGSIEVLVSLQ